MQKFLFFTASPLKMRACGTGRKCAEYDQRDWSRDTLKSNTCRKILLQNFTNYGTLFRKSVKDAIFGNILTSPPPTPAELSKFSLCFYITFLLQINLNL
jgi:hypothetical protein